MEIKNKMTTTGATGTQTQQFDVKAIADAFNKNLREPIERYLQDVNQSAEAGFDHLKNAVAAYNGDISARRDALKGKIDGIKAQLDECVREKQTAVDALSIALSSDDDAGEAAAKAAVDEVAQKEFVAQQRFNAMQAIKLTGRDDLVLAALDAFAEARQERHEKMRLSCTVRDLIDEMIDVLEQIRRKAELQCDDGGVSDRNAARAAWQVIEAHIGKVDFAHAHAGDEIACRYRFIEALCDQQFDIAFLDSPAGDTLRTALNKIAELRAKK